MFRELVGLIGWVEEGHLEKVDSAWLEIIQDTSRLGEKGSTYF